MKLLANIIHVEQQLRNIGMVIKYITHLKKKDLLIDKFLDF